MYMQFSIVDASLRHENSCVFALLCKAPPPHIFYKASLIDLNKCLPKRSSVQDQDFFKVYFFKLIQSFADYDNYKWFFYIFFKIQKSLVEMMSGLLVRILLKRASGDGWAVDKLGVTLTGTKVRQQNIKPFLLIFFRI